MVTPGYEKTHHCPPQVGGEEQASPPSHWKNVNMIFLVHFDTFFNALILQGRY